MKVYITESHFESEEGNEDTLEVYSTFASAQSRFNELKDIWNEYFEIDTDNCEITEIKEEGELYYNIQQPILFDTITIFVVEREVQR